MRTMITLSVIIPTYNRKEILDKCLEALFKQTCSNSNFEIIVIDDGSHDGTDNIVKAALERSPVEVKFFKQENKGPAAARNAGIKSARGEIVLFIGDDIIASPTLLEEHLNRHRENPDDRVAVLGYVTWSPDLGITPFMRWLENGGPQFSYHKLQHNSEVPWGCFWTCNISVKKRFLIENGLFDEEFPSAAYEDSELGYRLHKKGLELIYNRSAAAFHHHYTSLDDACLRMMKAGESAGMFYKKTGHPSGYISKSQMNNYLSKAKFLLYYWRGKFHEKRNVNVKVFHYLMDYSWFAGNEKYNK